MIGDGLLPLRGTFDIPDDVAEEAASPLKRQRRQTQRAGMVQLSMEWLQVSLPQSHSCVLDSSRRQ